MSKFIHAVEPVVVVEEVPLVVGVVVAAVAVVLVSVAMPVRSSSRYTATRVAYEPEPGAAKKVNGNIRIWFESGTTSGCRARSHVGGNVGKMSPCIPQAPSCGHPS